MDSVFNILPLFYIIEVFDDKNMRISTQKEKEIVQNLKEIKTTTTFTNTITNTITNQNQFINYEPNTKKITNTTNPNKKIKKMSISHLVDSSSPPKFEETYFK